MSEIVLILSDLQIFFNSILSRVDVEKCLVFHKKSPINFTILQFV
jgi:hypothetical protein